MAPKAVRRMAVNDPTELSSRLSRRAVEPERSAVEGPAVSLPTRTQNSLCPGAKPKIPCHIVKAGPAFLATLYKLLQVVKHLR
jgi:hypothetical protein